MRIIHWFVCVIASFCLCPWARAELVAYYDFYEGNGTVVNDRSGRGNHGFIVGNANWSEGKAGSGLYLDNASWVNLGDRSDLHFPAPGFTMMLWMKPVYGPGAVGERDAFWTMFCSRSDNKWAGPGYAVAFFSSEGSSLYTQPEDFLTIEAVFRRDVWDNRIETCLDPDKNIPCNNSIEIIDDWHHVAVRTDRDKAKCAIFVDGVKRSRSASNLVDNFYEPGSGPIYIGNVRWTWGSDWGFRGWVDEVKFFNTALSDQQLVEEMEVGGGDPPDGGDVADGSAGGDPGGADPGADAGSAADAGSDASDPCADEAGPGDSSADPDQPAGEDAGGDVSSGGKDLIAGSCGCSGRGPGNLPALLLLALLSVIPRRFPR